MGRWLAGIEIAERPAAIEAVRQSLAILPGASFRARGLGERSDNAYVDGVLSALRGALKKTDFAAVLTSVIVRHEDTVLRIGSDIIAAVDRSPTAQDVTSRIGELFTEAGALNEEARSELRTNSAVFDGRSLEEKVRLIVRNPPGVAVLRGDLVARFKEVATAVLRDDFKIENPLEMEPIDDDLTWLAVGNRAAPGGSS